MQYKIFVYKVVQIWPGLIVCKQVTVCPGHIWTTLYIFYNRADLRCKTFGICCSHLTFLRVFHCFNRFKTKFLGCYECFISVFCLWHIVALEFSPLLPTELFLCHLLRSTMKMFYTYCFSDLILQSGLLIKKLDEVFNNRRLTEFRIGEEGFRCVCVCVCVCVVCVGGGDRRSSAVSCRCQNQ
jgi:hypothetical protein